MFSVQFYVNLLTVFYIFYIFHITKVFSKIGLICAIFYPMFWYFRNKDHWWGLRSESKRLKVYNLLSYHFWTIKPIINNYIVWNLSENLGNVTNEHECLQEFGHVICLMHGINIQQEDESSTYSSDICIDRTPSLLYSILFIVTHTYKHFVHYLYFPHW